MHPEGRHARKLLSARAPLPPPRRTCNNRRTLEKFYIGDLRVRPGDEPQLVQYEEGSDFYSTLRGRVDAYFKKNGVRAAAGPPPPHLHTCARTALDHKRAWARVRRARMHAPRARLQQAHVPGSGAPRGRVRGGDAGLM